MEVGPLFNEEGVEVSSDFVRKGSVSLAVREITKIYITDYRTDWHAVPVLSLSAFFAFILWIAAPFQNAFMLIFLVPLVIGALHKHSSPNPRRYRVFVSTGGPIGNAVLDTTDEDQATRLQESIERAIAEPRSLSNP